jgi:hypothetical protein
MNEVWKDIVDFPGY